MDSDNRKLYNAYDKNWQRVYFDETSQGFVVAHRKHGRDELPQNAQVAIRLAKHFGECIELLPSVNIHQVISADSTRNGEIWEWKTTNGTTTSVQKRLRTAGTQANYILLILPPVFDESVVLRGIMSAVNCDKIGRILKIDLLLEKDKLVRLSREQIRKREFSDFYNALK